MSDDRNPYQDDLYGDLDLEDLDATALEEELVEPPEYDHVSPIPQQAVPPQAATASSSQAPPLQPNATVGAQTGQHDVNMGQAPTHQYGIGYGGGAGPSGGDRLRPADVPDEGKMFIGGLNWETTDDGLRAYMSQFGEIDSSTIMRDPTGRSRGFAFLTYVDPASVNKVMGQVHHLDGKQIDPKRAIPRAEHERTAKVFVGGLAPPVTSESLKAFLTQFGIVMDATVMYDRETGRSKGFAFATFADEESVGRAMEASGIELEGKQIEIKKAQPRGSGNLPNKFSNQNSGSRFNNFGGGASGGMGMGMGMSGGGGGMGAMGGMGGMGGASGGGFDPNAMAMMYQNMMKGNAMGGGMMGGGGFDPNAMAMMYQNMLKNMGMANAPAINPNMAMRNMGMNGLGGMAGMNGMGMGAGGMGMMGMGMGGMGMGMGNMGMGNMGMANGAVGNQMGMQQRPAGGMQARPIPNAPRGPAAMRNGSAAPPAAGGASGLAAPMASGGTGAQRYSTQGAARAKPY